MADRHSSGKTVFLIESNRFIREATVVKRNRDFCTIRFADGKGGIRVRPSRLFATKEAAEATLPKREKKPVQFRVW